MTSIDILTYGRLGKEFEENAKNIEGITCRFVSNDNLKEEIKKYEVIAGLSLPIDADISHIKWIHAFSAGVDPWMQRKDLNPGVLITKTKGRMGLKMGEYCLAWILYILKNIRSTTKYQEAHQWKVQSQENLLDQKVLVLGTGGIGEGISKVLKPLVKNITGVNTSGHPAGYFDDIVKFDDLGEDLSFYSVVINALPLTDSTRHIVNADIFKRFSKAIYFNVGRGDTTVKADLVDALKNQHIKKAVLDVFEKEPLPADSDYWYHTDIIVTPHQSAVTDIEDVKMSFTKALKAYRTGALNELVVNKEKKY